MRTQKEVTIKEVDQVFCDKCGDEIPYKTECFNINHTFGYFSSRDGDRISLDICEGCMEDILGEKLMKKGLLQANDDELNI